MAKYLSYRLQTMKHDIEQDRMEGSEQSSRDHAKVVGARLLKGDLHGGGRPLQVLLGAESTGTNKSHCLQATAFFSGKSGPCNL